MTPRTLGLTDPLHHYVTQVGIREPEELKLVREETLRLPGAHMLLAPEQAQFMALLARLIDVRHYIEIGTYTGYSALAIALALEGRRRIITCEIDQAFAAIAERHWQRAGVAHKIELRLGPALQTLDAMLAAAAESGRFDVAFIDADKENLVAYYERCLMLLRPGGLILIDNTLWSGSVADDSDHDPSTEAIRAFNVMVHDDRRVDMVLLPIGDGLTIARKII